MLPVGAGLVAVGLCCGIVVPFGWFYGGSVVLLQ